MIPGYATPEGTRRFADRSPARADFYTLTDELAIASVGVGTYVPEPYKEQNYLFSYEDALLEALKQGSNLIDTAINYRYQTSEREIAKALKMAFDQGIAKRDEVVIASKGGFIPMDFPFPEPYQWIQTTMIDGGLTSADEIVADQHCLSPEFLKWSLEQSRKNLDLETIDIYYLHNPEFQLGYVPYETLMERIKGAFALYERAADEGKIRYYGVASWNAFVFAPEHQEYIRLSDLVGLAREVGGENHRFRYVQMPYNLAKPHAFNFSNQPLEDGLYYTPVQAANKLGLHVITSSALLQMNLFRAPFGPKVSGLLGQGFTTEVQKALQFARSGAGITAALFSSSWPDHIADNLRISTIPRTDPKRYWAIFNL